MRVTSCRCISGRERRDTSSLLSSLAAENVDRMFRRLFTRGYKPDFLFSFFPFPYSKRERERDGGGSRQVHVIAISHKTQTRSFGLFGYLSPGNKRGKLNKKIKPKKKKEIIRKCTRPYPVLVDRSIDLPPPPSLSLSRRLTRCLVLRKEKTTETKKKKKTKK